MTTKMNEIKTEQVSKVRITFLSNSCRRDAVYPKIN